MRRKEDAVVLVLPSAVRCFEVTYSIRTSPSLLFDNYYNRQGVIPTSQCKQAIYHARERTNRNYAVINLLLFEHYTSSATNNSNGEKKKGGKENTKNESKK